MDQNDITLLKLDPKGEYVITLKGPLPGRKIEHIQEQWKEIWKGSGVAFVIDAGASVEKLPQKRARRPAWAFFERWRIRFQSFKYRPWLRCSNACGWAWPYGYVPEDGCSIHDPDCCAVYEQRNREATQ